MSNDTTVRVTADATGYSAALAAATRSAQAFMQTQEQASQRVAAAQQAIAESATNGSNASASAINRFVKALTQEAATAGKTRDQLLELKAAQLGVSDSAAPFIAQIKAATAAQESMQHSSAGVNRELLVMLHEASQGNFTRLGGSALVLAERFNAVKLIMNPVALGLAATAAAGYLVYEAFNSAQESVAAIANALATTNNWSNQSSDSISSLASTLSDEYGGSVREATKLLTEMTSSGKVLGSNFAETGAIITMISQTSGEDIEKVSERILAQGDDVTKASQVWQDQHHTMSQATLDLIKTLDDQGQHTKALRALLDQEYADMTAVTKAETEKQRGFWASLGDEITRSVRSFAGTSSLTDKLKNLNDAKDSFDYASNPDYKKSVDDQIAAINSQLAAQDKQKARQDAVTQSQQELADSTKAVTAALKDAMSQDEKRAAQLVKNKQLIDNERSAAQALGQLTPQKSADLDSAQSKLDAHTNEEFKPKSTAAIENAGNSAAIKNAQQSISDLNDSYKNSAAILKQQHDAGTIDDDDYYGGLQDNIDKTISSQMGQIDIEERLLQQSNVTGAARIKLNQELKDLEKQRYDLFNKWATLQYTTDGDQTKSDTGRQSSLDKYNKSLQAALDTQREAIANQVMAVGSGSQEFARQQNLTRLSQQFDKKDTTLSESLASATPDVRATIQAEMASNDAMRDATVKAWQQGYAAIDAAQGDWQNGATRAFANYEVAARDVAGQTASVFQDTFRGMEDAITSFVTTGKLNFSSLANSVITDIVRMEVRAQEAQAIQFIGGLFGPNLGTQLGATGSGAPYGFGGSAVTAATGGLISGPGTGTSDSIHAMLSDGEYVLKAEAVRRLGKSNLDDLNNGANVHHFATGGMVGSAADSASTAASNSTQIHIGVNASGGGHGGSSFSQNDAKQLQTAVERWVDTRMKQKMGGQGGFAYQLRNGQLA